jgi:hypothetical protein
MASGPQSGSARQASSASRFYERPSMRFCNQCHRLTVGSPLYCNFCGASYDVKLCPARHMNPRSADVCSECGSRDLSAPAPQLPVWLVPLLNMLSILAGLVLALLSLLVLIGLSNIVVVRQTVEPRVILAVLIVALLWLLYMRLPGFLSNLFSSGSYGIRRRNKPR